MTRSSVRTELRRKRQDVRLKALAENPFERGALTQEESMFVIFGNKLDVSKYRYKEEPSE